jgi:hypothetical protein
MAPLVICVDGVKQKKLVLLNIVNTRGFVKGGYFLTQRPFHEHPYPLKISDEREFF